MPERDTYPERILKYCPRCSGHFTPQHDFSFICSDCGMHFFSNACAAVCALILDSEGKLLVTIRGKDPKKGMLDLPGGFVDPLETIEDALKRELMEELGVDVTDMKYLCSYPNLYVYSGLTYFTIDLAFICRVEDISTIKPADDVEDAFFIYPDKIDLNEIAFVSIRNIISFFIKSNNN
jgi:NADH pyrophosphatase NudC (nudix superfamily)